MGKGDKLRLPRSYPYFGPAEVCDLPQRLWFTNNKENNNFLINSRLATYGPIVNSGNRTFFAYNAIACANNRINISYITRKILLLQKNSYAAYNAAT